MFVWTISDAIGAIVLIVALTLTGLLKLLEWLGQSSCKHDGGINETQACEAICRKCSKNLGFIGTWREKQKVTNY